MVYIIHYGHDLTQKWSLIKRDRFRQKQDSSIILTTKNHSKNVHRKWHITTLTLTTSITRSFVFQQSMATH